MLGNSEDERTLFVGDLSIYCGEADLEALFAQFGPIERVTLKRGNSATTNLSYGFVKFFHRESAEAANVMKGFVFMGRPIRIGRAGPKVTDKPIKAKEGPSRRDTAQIHVSFISKQVDALITEETLRSLFSHYGTVVDVAIKKSKFDQNLKVQNGYGFIHYALTSEGIQSAITATREVHQITVDRVIYDCTLSHLLETYLTPEQIAFAYSSPTPPEFKGRPYERKREMYNNHRREPQQSPSIPPLFHSLPLKPSLSAYSPPQSQYNNHLHTTLNKTSSFFDTTIGFDEGSHQSVVSSSQSSLSGGTMSHLSSWESTTFAHFLGGGGGGGGGHSLNTNTSNNSMRQPLDLYPTTTSTTSQTIPERLDLSKLLGLPAEPSSPITSHSATSTSSSASSSSNQSRPSEEVIVEEERDVFSMLPKPSLFPDLPDFAALAVGGPLQSLTNQQSFFFSSSSWY